MTRTLFQEKINYLFEQLNMQGKEKEFVSLFSPTQHIYSDRKKVVIGKWLYGKMKKNPYWKFEEYPISKEKINGILAFDEYCFGDEESFELFKERVDSYIVDKIYFASKKDDFEYKYIYYFNFFIKKITFLKLDIIKEHSDNNYTIKLTPSSFYKKSIDSYIGTLIKKGNHYQTCCKIEKISIKYQYDKYK